MKEIVTLIFGNGKRFEWKTWKVGHTRKAIKLQKKFGDPVDIIGDGTVAQTLRKKYEVYNRNKQEYKPSVFGTAGKLSGIAKGEIEEKFKSSRIFKRFRKSKNGK